MKLELLDTDRQGRKMEPILAITNKEGYISTSITIAELKKFLDRSKTETSSGSMRYGPQYVD